MSSHDFMQAKKIFPIAEEQCGDIPYLRTFIAFGASNISSKMNSLEFESGLRLLETVHLNHKTALELFGMLSINQQILSTYEKILS